MEIECLTKNRLLSEKRFFLNKSNTKWIAVGIKPGHLDLNGCGFAVDIRIAGDNGKFISLGNPAVAGLENLISICRNIINPGSGGEIENSMGLLVNAFPMNNAMCYNFSRNDESICVGHSSIEGLIEMHHFLMAYLKKINVDAVEKAFLDYLSTKDVEQMLEKATEADIELHINFADFVMVCSELKNVETGEPDDENGEPAAKKSKRVQIKKTSEKAQTVSTVPAK